MRRPPEILGYVVREVNTWKRKLGALLPRVRLGPQTPVHRRFLRRLGLLLCSGTTERAPFIKRPREVIGLFDFFFFSMIFEEGFWVGFPFSCAIKNDIFGILYVRCGRKTF